MKIAVCFSGMIRTGVYASENIKSHIGRLYSNVDFFMHTWDVTEKKPWHPESIINEKENPIESASSSKLIEDIRRVYDNKFISINVENFMAWKEEYHDYKNFSPLWYSWMRSVELKSKYEVDNNFLYDIVVKLRPDCIYPDTSKLSNEIRQILSDPEKFYIMNYSLIRADDVYFASSSILMDRASRFFKETKKREWETDLFGSYLKEIGINCSNTAHNTYTILREEALKEDYKNFNLCYNIDRDYYCPKTTIDRLPI